MKHSKFAIIVLVLVLLFLYLPIFIMVGDSFNADKYCGKWLGFTFKWYGALFSHSNRNIWMAFERSIIIAITATLSSCILGTSAALAIHKWKGRLQTFHYSLIYTPLVMPEILMGISLLMLFTAIGLNCGMWTIWIAHTTFCVSYVTMTILARLQDFDDRILEAAYDLGASPWTAFFKVQLPVLMPGIIAGGLLAFTLSIDDFVITFFVTGPGSDTLPLQVYSMIKHSKQLPVINALSTLMIVFTCTLVFLSRIVSSYKKKGRSLTQLRTDIKGVK